eukprot:XP_011669118.1 PREDICTED: altered inheritance of mitochondria protein 3-like [Strongylocentrotus purpuratus]
MARASCVNPVHANTIVSPDTLPRVIVGPPRVIVGPPRVIVGLPRVIVGPPLHQPCTLKNPEPSQPQCMPSNLQSGMSAGFHTPAPNEPFSGYYCSPEYREAHYNPTYHATMSSSAPNPPVSRHDQPIKYAGYLPPTQNQPPVHGSTGATRTVMPWSSQDHYTQPYNASPSSSVLLCNPPVSGYHQPAMWRRHISDTPYQPMMVDWSGSSRPEPSQNCSTPGFHSASSTPSRPGSSSQREGSSSSQSRPCKRQAPSTQSRAPQGDPEIPERRSKYEV